MPLPGLLYSNAALWLDQRWPLDAARSPLGSLKPICSRGVGSCFTANTAKAEAHLRQEPRRATFTPSRIQAEEQGVGGESRERDGELIHLKSFFTPPHHPHCDLNTILVTAVIESLKST